ncbi:hypothetical protein [Pseudomonas sp. HY7a-MNA-CIBAN-0227]|uniref:hypothetical protein n=1 Tax=Pseudomonas sp. HY7a-MNA-CIBAN-0227 TaxID=3140474 RepID=UPI0033177457
MTEPKNEQYEVTAQEYNGLFDYTNKLPDNLTNKDMDWLRKRIDSGLPTDTPKSKKIKSAIKVYIEEKANIKGYDSHLFVALFCSIAFSFSFAFGVSGLSIGNLFLPLGMAIAALAGTVRNNENALAAYALLNKKPTASVATIIYRNVMPALAFLIPMCFLYGMYDGHQHDPAKFIDLVILLSFCLATFALRKLSEMLIAETLKQYQIGNATNEFYQQSTEDSHDTNQQ